VSVPVDSSAIEVAFIMDKYDFLAMPVVDEQQMIKGIITIDDILALAIDEAWGEKPGLL
jgi:magnesium transporter